MKNGKHLRELIAAVENHIKALDREMKAPSTVQRGERIAALINQLELAKDLAKRFGG